MARPSRTVYMREYRQRKRQEKMAAHPHVASPGPIAGRKPPDGMDGHAAAMWRSIVPRMVAAGEWDERYRLTLVEACENYAILVEARKAVQTSGFDGNPAVSVMRSCSTAHRDFCKAFGLTPAALKMLAPKDDVTALEPPPSAEDAEDAALAEKYG